MTILNLGNRVVNNYLISSEAGWILIDTGYAGGFPRFMKRLKKHHIPPKDIRYVFQTHAHDDHAGFLNEVLAATDAQVILHPKAIEGLKSGQNSFKGGCSSCLAWLFCQVLALFGHGDHRYHRSKRSTWIAWSLSIQSGLRRCASPVRCFGRRGTQRITSRSCWRIKCSAATLR